MHVDTADFDVDEDGQDTMLGYAGDETENVALLTSSMSTHLGMKLSVVAPRAAAQHRSIQSPQQRNHNKPEQQSEQAIQERESREREKEKERAAGEEGNKEVKKDVTDWVEVKRRSRRKSRKMIQIFVKVNGGKTSVMEIEMSDKVDDIVKKISISDRDVYVTSGGRILRRSDELESCEVRDGSIVEVTSRMRGGGRHKDKRNKAQNTRGRGENGQEEQQVETVVGGCPEMTQSQKDVVIQRLERNEGYREIIKMISETGEEEHGMRCFRVLLRQELGFNEETMKVMEWGVRWAVEARRKGRDEQREQRRQAEQGEKTEQEQSKQDKQVRFGEEQQLGKTGAENAGEPEVMGRTTEVRTGRGSVGLVRGEDERYWADETSKGKGEGDGGKGEHEGKGGGFGHNGKQQETRERREERVRMAPNMGGWWLTPPGHVGSRRERNGGR